MEREKRKARGGAARWRWAVDLRFRGCEVREPPGPCAGCGAAPSVLCDCVPF